MRVATPLLFAALVAALLLVTNRAPDADPPAPGPPAPGASEGDSGKPAPPSRDLVPPVGLPVQLDGQVVPAEWADAAQRPIGSEGAVLKVKQVRGTLLLALDAPSAWPPTAHLWFVFGPDDDRGTYDPGSFRLDFEPLEHNRPHLLVTRMGQQVDEVLQGVAVARASVHGTRCSVEVAVDLGALGVEGDDAPPLRFACLWMRGKSGSPSWPNGLRVDAEPGFAPADLLSSARWGRLAGWQDAGGAGAFSATEWSALLEADEELARRGRDAHAVGLEIAEEPNLRKQDRDQVPALVENLRWIARHEPLTPYDLLVLAQGHRFLNRHAEALAILDALESHASYRDGERLLYERARTLESMERYAEAALVWERMATERPTRRAESYGSMARRAEARAGERASEERERMLDRARPDLPLVLLRTTRGDVVMQLFRDDVEASVDHFLALVRRRQGERGFYDGSFFHRVIGNFVAQGGDPRGRDEGCDFAGSGDGPSTIPVEANERHGFWRGAVGLARGPAPRSGCQFFILVSPRPELADMQYTCLGHVISGMDVVDRLETCDEILEMRVLGDAPEGDGGGRAVTSGVPASRSRRSQFPMPCRVAPLLLVAALLAVPVGAGPDDALDRCLQEWEMVVRRQDERGRVEQRAVLHRMATLRTPAARDALRSLRDRYGTSRPNLTADILGAYVRHGGADEIDETIHWVERSREPLQLELLGRALGEAREPEARAHLRGTALRRATPPTKVHILRGIALAGDRAATPALLLLLAEQNVKVRVEAFEALGTIGDPRAVSAVLVFLRDPDARIRAAAARTLGRLGEARVVERLAGALADDDARVVENAAEALERFDGPGGVPELVAALERAVVDDLRLADVLAGALQKISGKSFGPDAVAWRAWWETVRDRPWQRYEMDPSERTVPGTRYYGFPVRSSKLVFVLDISRSMGWNDRLDGAKRELLRVLDLLPPTTRFNVVVFSDAATAWQPDLKAATRARIREASSFIRRQRPQNGTNTFHALQVAFADRDVDTVFLLSDGNPTGPAEAIPDRILLHVRSWNRYRRVRVHCVALLRGDPPSGYAGMEDRERSAAFMRRLSEENGGRFRIVE